MSASQLETALAGAHRVFLDTSVCIAYHSRAEPAHPVARELFARIAWPEDPLKGYLSVISVAELLVRPIRSGVPELSFMHAFVRGFPNLTVLPVDTEVALEAANLRALARLSMPDALIVASALLAGCEAIVSNDSQWHRRLRPVFSQFRWVYLGDLLP